MYLPESQNVTPIWGKHVQKNYIYFKKQSDQVFT